jgi:Subtilisin inhibitor-like
MTRWLTRTAFATGTGLVLLVSACGGQDDVAVTDPGAASSGQPQASASAGAASGPTRLTVEVDDGTGKTTTWTLSCDPPGGDLPDAAAACTALAADGDELLAPARKGLVCTELYGGPQTATITGTRDGARVLATYSRVNGCEISRWNAMDQVLPKIATGPS